MLLTPLAAGTSALFEQSLQSLFTRVDQKVEIEVHMYQTERCLLSDRGVSSPIPQDPHLVFDFNLRSDAFIRFIFIDLKAVLGHPVPERIQRAMVRRLKPVQLSYPTDDVAALRSFHHRVVEQCYERVYCSVPKPVWPYGEVMRRQMWSVPLRQVPTPIAWCG